MANHSESELKALKVADLKELCTARSLPTTGRKDELIARLLESDPSSSTAAPAEESTEVNYDDDEPAAAEPVAAAPTSTEDPAAAEPPTTAATSHAAVTDAPATADTAASVDDAGTKAVESEAADAKAKPDADEIERQKRRAARFGIPYVEKAQPTPPKPRTGAKPPSMFAPAAKKGPEERKAAAVPDKPKSGTTTPKPAPAPKVVDPAEEERKRKRAERFGLPVGGESEEKKQKV